MNLVARRTDFSVLFSISIQIENISKTEVRTIHHALKIDIKALSIRHYTHVLVMKLVAFHKKF